MCSSDLRSRAREPQLLSPRAATTEAHAPRARAPQQREATAMRSPRTATKSSPHSPQLEKAHTQQQRPNTARKKKKEKKKRNILELCKRYNESIRRATLRLSGKIKTDYTEKEALTLSPEGEEGIYG